MCLLKKSGQERKDIATQVGISDFVSISVHITTHLYAQLCTIGVLALVKKKFSRILEQAKRQ